MGLKNNTSLCASMLLLTSPFALGFDDDTYNELKNLNADTLLTRSVYDSHGDNLFLSPIFDDSGDIEHYIHSSHLGQRSIYDIYDLLEIKDSFGQTIFRDGATINDYFDNGGTVEEAIRLSKLESNNGEQIYSKSIRYLHVTNNGYTVDDVARLVELDNKTFSNCNRIELFLSEDTKNSLKMAEQFYNPLSKSDNDYFFPYTYFESRTDNLDLLLISNGGNVPGGTSLYECSYPNAADSFFVNYTLIPTGTENIANFCQKISK